MKSTRRAAARGFSMIELGIALAILGVVVSLGLPTFRSWIGNSRVRTAAEAMLNGVQLARAEAVRQNANVQFVLGPQSAWTVNVIGSGGVLVFVQGRNANEGSASVAVAVTPAGATTLTLNGLGRVVANGDGTPSITTITASSMTLAAADARNMQIKLGTGGNVRMCDPQIIAVGDPRAC